MGTFTVIKTWEKKRKSQAAELQSQQILRVDFPYWHINA